MDRNYFRLLETAPIQYATWPELVQALAILTSRTALDPLMDRLLL